MCAGKVMGPGGEAIKALSERSGCSVVVEGKVRCRCVCVCVLGGVTGTLSISPHSCPQARARTWRRWRPWHCPTAPSHPQLPPPAEPQRGLCALPPGQLPGAHVCQHRGGGC